MDVTVAATLAGEHRVSAAPYPVELFLESFDHLVSATAENAVDEPYGRVITVDLALAPYLGWSLSRLVRSPRATPDPVRAEVHPNADPWDSTRHGLVPDFVDDAADAYRRSLRAPRYVVIAFTPSATPE